MGLSREDLAILVDVFEQSPWTEMALQIDGARVELSRSGSPPRRAEAHAAAAPGDAAAGEAATPAGAPDATRVAAAAASPPAATPGAATHEVLAPSVGIFYRAPEPGAPAFVEPGARVAPEDIVGIVEVMKLMNHVQAGAAGAVRAIHVENGVMVEHGQVLVTIELDAA